ncbi:Protein PHLOEM PROTEIN 2-LIKE A10 [Platanthera guangdongensis]|uniref:Protein PHLOEM PROTEIN 2-LIKE A10 n=1 Tax=Platanthera guangdongensis TaxID=2320717 RepID=A0ABR2MKV3_9ASPA
MPSYGSYRVYHHPSAEAKRRKLVNIFSALISVGEAVSSSSYAVNLLSSDLNNFLRSNSDEDEIPQSLMQIAKIARSAEFSASISRVSEALTVGICVCVFVFVCFWCFGDCVCVCVCVYMFVFVFVC